MNRSAAGRFGAVSCLAALASASAVIAQPAPSVAATPLGVELRYEAFASCPDRAAFAQNLDARRRGAVGAVGAVQMDVRLRRLADRVEGSIAVTSHGGVPSARRIVAPTCGEAADALALIAALVLQGIEVEEVPADEGGSEKRDDPDDKRGGRRAERSRSSESPASERTTPDPSEAAAAAATEQTITNDAASASDAVSASDASDESGEALEESDDEVAAQDDPVEPAGSAHTSRAYVLLSGGVASGVLPALQLMPELSLSWEHGARDFPLWSLHAAFRISTEQTRHFEQGVVAFGWWTGLAAACLAARHARLSAGGCAVLEVGALSGGATETDNPRDEQGAWVALGPGLTIAYDVTPILRVQLRAEVLTPLVRYRLELPEGTAVHEPSLFGLRAGFGAGLQLW